MCYIITIGVGWALRVNILNGSTLIFGAAITTTIPAVGALVTLLFGIMFAQGPEDAPKPFLIVCTVLLYCIVLSAGLFEIVGAILFITAGVVLKDEGSKVLAYSMSAGIIGLTGGLACCFSTACCVAGSEIPTKVVSSFRAIKQRLSN